MRTIVCAAILILFAGCAPKTKFPEIAPGLAAEEARKQREAVVDARIADHDRLWNVAFRIAGSNADLCGDGVRPRFGFLSVTLDQIPEEWKEVWRDRLGVGENPTIMAVAKGSPAERAGLRPGDRLLRIGDTDIGTGRDALAKADLPDDGRPMDVVIEREGGRRTLTASRARVCHHPVTLTYDDRVNAFADGKNVIITTGMLRFARKDEELALIVGHELAHNTRGHIDSKRANMLIGGLLGAAVSVFIGVDVTNTGMQAGAGAFSQEFEAEADYVGVYHAARAGYDMRGAASFWRRMAVAHPRAIHLAGSTHPSTAQRFLAIEKAADEVDRKRKAGQPLVPEER